MKIILKKREYEKLVEGRRVAENVAKNLQKQLDESTGNYRKLSQIYGDVQAENSALRKELNVNLSKSRQGS